MAEAIEGTILRAAQEPVGQRAVKLIPYLNRTIPYWGHPGYLAGQQWRALVANQPIAIICRDTLTANLLSMSWSVRARESSDTQLQIEKDEIDHYTDVFNEAEGDFDNYVELILQDLLDLPFGAMAEVGRLRDDPEGPVMWVEHVDAATLVPTGDRKWPVMQNVPGSPGRPVVFPKHSIVRTYMTPSPQIKRKGWGMAPPEKVYLAIEMLYRGDRYYANLLLDTPEAGILDLMNMATEDVEEWVDSWRNLMSGIDGMKVPIIHGEGRDKPAVWIPLNRPPTDMLYDQTTLKYAAITCAGYGIRLSDIGLEGQADGNTLAGVIRGERQTRRNGRAVVRSKMENHFNTILPNHLQFIWEEKDEEAKTEQGRALSTYGLALGQLKRDGIMSPEETRVELVATGLLEVEIDPTDVPEPEVPMGMPGQGVFAKPGSGDDSNLKKDKRKPFGKPNDKDRGRVKNKKEKVSPVDGGRGSFKTRVDENALDTRTDELAEIVAPSIKGLVNIAAQAGGRQYRKSTPDSPVPPAPRVRRLIKAATRAMFPEVQKVFEQLDDEAIQKTWLPEMISVDFQLPNEIESLTVRQSAEEIAAALESHLIDDPWWKVADAWEKDAILTIFKNSYEDGLEDMALDIIRSLYEEALLPSPNLGVGISFDLVNKRTLSFLESSAADLVTNVNNGTKFFIKRIVTSGVRLGLSTPRIASAIRDGAKAADVLAEDGFMNDAINETLDGLIEMSEARSLSIAVTEVARATNLGALQQIKRTGLKTKAWEHLGARGISPAGNEHPCPFCKGNEEMGFVDVEFLYPTVFSSGGPDGDGKQPTPPAHPNVDHCRMIFDDDELLATIERGEYAPYLGD